MYLYRRIRGGKKVGIVVRDRTKSRLRTTCFRGIRQSLAGNFALWESAESLFADQEIMKEFLDELNHLVEQREYATHSVCIVHSEYVGWESTAPRAGYASEVLERFTLNARAFGLRIAPQYTELRAPLTRKVTIVFEFVKEERQSVAIVHSIYPGEDVGDLRGDVTGRERRIFFDWNHPGAHG